MRSEVYIELKEEYIATLLCLSKVTGIVGAMGTILLWYLDKV